MVSCRKYSKYLFKSKHFSLKNIKKTKHIIRNVHDYQADYTNAGKISVPKTTTLKPKRSLGQLKHQSYETYWLRVLNILFASAKYNVFEYEIYYLSQLYKE